MRHAWPFLAIGLRITNRFRATGRQIWLNVFNRGLVWFLLLDPDLLKDFFEAAIVITNLNLALIAEIVHTIDSSALPAPPIRLELLNNIALLTLLLAWSICSRSF